MVSVPVIAKLLKVIRADCRFLSFLLLCTYVVRTVLPYTWHVYSTLCAYNS